MWGWQQHSTGHELWSAQHCLLQLRLSSGAAAASHVAVHELLECCHVGGIIPALVQGKLHAVDLLLLRRHLAVNLLTPHHHDLASKAGAGGKG